jgi:NAD(P)-dependent dehydrogenase (short-subunit alcohol dehydrogenase family)
VARILISGSADGVGRAAPQRLLGDGHEVVVTPHVRNNDRLAAVRDLVDRGAAAVVGDLSEPDQTGDIADQVNDLGQMSAVIHNAGVYTGPDVMPVNNRRAYLLTALIDRPQRLVYLSSGDQRRGQPRLTGMDRSAVGGQPHCGTRRADDLRLGIHGYGIATGVSRR